MGSSAKVCSPSCWSEIRRKNRILDGIEGIDYLSCKICGTHAKDLSSHYRRYHPDNELQRPLKCQKLIDNSSGENNPAYGHGGKLSPFSKKFVHYKDEETRKSILKKQGEMRKRNGSNPFTREYYGSVEEFSKAQTRDLAWFIKKFGEIEGPIRHANKIEKWQNTLNLKPEDEKRRINRMKVSRNGAISKAEKEIIQILKENEIYVNDQFQLNRGNKKYYIYDIERGNKIIEYNGDFWHCNPILWESTKYNTRLHMTAGEKWILDLEKIQFAKDRGYEVLVIWESDYKQNKENIIQKCLNFLTQ